MFLPDSHHENHPQRADAILALLLATMAEPGGPRKLAYTIWILLEQERAATRAAQAEAQALRGRVADLEAALIQETPMNDVGRRAEEDARDIAKTLAPVDLFVRRAGLVALGLVGGVALGQL